MLLPVSEYPVLVNIQQLKAKIAEAKQKLRDLPPPPPGKHYNTLDLGIKKMKRELAPLVAYAKRENRKYKKTLAVSGAHVA